MKLNHFDEYGNAHMVDVSDKDVSERVAVAEGNIHVCPEVFEAIKNGKAKKGDVLGTAQLAGIMGAKKTFELIPMCHIINLTHLSVTFDMDDKNFTINCRCTAKVIGRTGVEMEAITGVSIALLTIYDMCKAMDKSMEIGNIHLVEKSGGKSGHYRYNREEK